jgi:hypothetical protein
VAGQAALRRQAVVGRPDGAGRQRRPRGHGLRDPRLRRRAPRRLGARSGVLGQAQGVPGQPARPRRQARQAPGRGPDGPHLRQPRGPRRQARPGGLGQGYPRGLRADEHGRRGDRRADRWRSHLRQGPRRPQAGRLRRRRAGGGWRRGPGLRLEEQVRQGSRRRHRDQRPRGRVDGEPGRVHDQLPRQPDELRVGPDQEPGRRDPVDPVGPQGRDPGARRPRPQQAPRPDHAHHRSRAQGRPGLPRGGHAVPEGPGAVQAGLRAGVVQAHPPRHGTQGALPRPPTCPPSSSPGRTRCRR